VSDKNSGKLDLVFSSDPDGRTYVDKQYSSYPFHFCRPFYLDWGKCKEMATIYTQSCSGGLYTLDSLETNIDAKSGTKVHLTTQSSTVVHEGTEGAALQTTNISVSENALVEYLPDPVIMMPAANLDSRLIVTIDAKGSAILVDSFLAHDFEGLGRPFGKYKSNLVIQDINKNPLIIDRFNLDGETFNADLAGVMGKYTCHANIILFGAWATHEETLNNCRVGLQQIDTVMAGVSALPSELGLSVRILAPDAINLKNGVNSIWIEARRSLFGENPNRRRK